MTEMVKKPGTDRRHTCWTLAQLAGCGDPDVADVVAEATAEVPRDWPVQPLTAGQIEVLAWRPDEVNGGYKQSPVATCGSCGRSWDDETPTAMTPAPAGRCPFESFHGREYEPGSAGARFLRSVEDAVYEAWEYATEEYNGDDPADMVKLMQTDGRVTELADSAVPIYYGDLWATFTDLAAYDEEIDDTSYVLADDGRSVNPHKLAGVALYMIAERLAWALLEELAEGDEEAEEREEPIWIGVTSGQVVTITTPEGEEIRGKVETYDADEIHVESLDTDSYWSHRMMLFTREEVATIG